MAAGPFAGDKKKGTWVLAKAERQMVNWLVPKPKPRWELHFSAMAKVLRV